MFTVLAANHIEEICTQLAVERQRVQRLVELVERLERGYLSDLMDEEEIPEFWERCSTKKELDAILWEQSNG